MPETSTCQTKMVTFLAVAVFITAAAALMSVTHRNNIKRGSRTRPSIKTDAVYAQPSMNTPESGSSSEKVVRITGTFTVVKVIRDVRSKSFQLPPEEVLAQFQTAKVRGLQRRVKRFACWHSCFGSFRKKVFRMPYAMAQLPSEIKPPQSSPKTNTVTNNIDTSIGRAVGAEGIRAKKSANASEYFKESSSPRAVVAVTTTIKTTTSPPLLLSITNKPLSLLKVKNSKVDLKPLVNVTVVEKQMIEPPVAKGGEDESESASGSGEEDDDGSTETSESDETSTTVKNKHDTKLSTAPPRVQQADSGDGIDKEDLEEEEKMAAEK